MVNELLVIIDPQNDFTHLDGNYASRHKRITQIAAAKANIKSLLPSFDRSKTVIIRSDYKPDQFSQGLSICIPDTFGHEVDRDLQADDLLNVVTKTEHSCFSSEEFKQLLQKDKIDTLMICGFLAEYCIKLTAMDALQSGYKVWLIEDCIATGDDVQHRKKQAFDELIKNGALIIQSKELYY